MPFLSSVQAPQPQAPLHTEDTTQGWPWRQVLLAGVLLVALLLAILTWGLTSEQRAVERMDPQARAMLFNETWQGFQLLCQQKPDPGVVPRCRDQARFLLYFPECGDDCRRELSVFQQASR